MLSMTGFGSGEGQSGPVTLNVELRSVNHRFLDVSLKLPGSLAAYEAEIRQFLKDNVARGRVTVTVSQSLSRTETPVALDERRLEDGLQMLQEIAARLEKTTGNKSPLNLDHVLAIPDLFRAEEIELDDEDTATALRQALRHAHTGMMAMKVDEGSKLVDEMNQRLETLETSLAEVRKRAPEAADEIFERLQERVQKLTTDAIDPQRMAQEVALIADRANINEECERLGIHIEHFRAALAEGGQVAKRLNFLLQEMHREVNTMGSKTNLMDITQAVITMKDEVESLREQIQNLE